VTPLRVVVLLRGGGPCDDAALRAGLALGEVTVASVTAPPGDDEALREALARGAGRALRVRDASLEGIDYHGTAQVLAALARHAGFDVVLCGERSADEAQGAVGPAVAEALDLAQVTAALDVRAEDGGIVIERRDGGGRRTLRLPAPLLVTVTRSPAPPARPRESPPPAIEALDLEALGIQAQELRHRVRCAGREAPRRGGGALLLPAEELIERLLDERLLEP